MQCTKEQIKARIERSLTRIKGILDGNYGNILLAMEQKILNEAINDWMNLNIKTCDEHRDSDWRNPPIPVNNG